MHHPFHLAGKEKAEKTCNKEEKAVILHPIFKGCLPVQAEMIPSKPDPGNAGVGMDNNRNTPFWFIGFIQEKSLERE